MFFTKFFGPLKFCQSAQRAFSFSPKRLTINHLSVSKMNYKQLVAEQRKHYRSGETQSYEHRVQALQRLRKLLSDNRERFQDAVYKDLRRERRTTNFVEIEACLNEIDYFLDNLKDWMQPEYAERTLATMFDDLYMVREPYGVSLLLGPFNYPLALILLPLIALIAGGNTVILKPSELTPTCALLFEQLFTEAFDNKYIAVVQANAQETVELLRERFDIIMFTGSTTVGRAVMKSAAEHLTPVVLEMGGKCPALIEEDADMLVTARRIIWGKYMNCGQTCIAPDYLIMTQKTRELLFTHLQQVIGEFYGDDISQNPDYSRIVNERHFDRIDALLKQTKGKVLFSGGQSNREDLFIPPMIIEVDDANDVLMTGEIFGPILPIYIVKDFDEALEFLRHREAPINSYIFTRSEQKTERLIKEIPSGNVLQNDVIMNFTVDTLPFGGFGSSGMGQYRGKFGFDTFSHRKGVMKRKFFFDFLMSPRYSPMTDTKHSIILFLTARWTVPQFLKRLLEYGPWILVGVFLHYMFGST